MSDKHYIGLDVTSFENTGKHKPVSRVTLFLDNENYYTAGDDTGKEITANCPSATQAMADALLAKLQGYEHQSFNADAANIDPAAELGDGVTVGGIYATLSRLKDDGNGYAGVGAADEPEIEEEYPYVSPIQQEIKRQSTEIYSVISKTAEEIRLEVQREVEGLSSSFSVALESITARVQGLDSAYTELSVTIDGVTVTDPDGTTKIKGSSIETDTLYVNAANITGTLQANQINLTGAITFNDLTSDVQNDINDAYSVAVSASDTASSAASTAASAASTANDAWYMAYNASGTVSSWKYGGTTYIDGSKIMTGTVYASYLMGGSVGILNSSGSQIGYITVGSSTSSGIQLVSGGNLYLQSASCFISLVSNTIRVSCDYFAPQGTASYLGHSSYGMWQAVYAYTSTIQTSDRNLKNSIEELDGKYLRFILWLTPHRYKMNNGTSDRYHVGFIAQDVEEGMELFGITDLEFAGFIRDVDADGTEILMLRYEEFIGLLTLALQDHEERLIKLEAAA